MIGLELQEIPDKMDAVLQNKSQIEQLARVYRQVDDFYYLGRGITFPVAL